MFPVKTEYFFMDSCLKICAVKEIIKADYCKLLSHKAFMGITKSNRKRTFFQFQVTDKRYGCIRPVCICFIGC